MLGLLDYNPDSIILETFVQLCEKYKTLYFRNIRLKSDKLLIILYTEFCNICEHKRV